MANCDRCGANLKLVGKAHNCTPRTIATAPVNMANADHLANNMANSITADVANADSPTYRYRDTEKRRVYQRDLMRRKRAEKAARAS